MLNTKLMEETLEFIKENPQKWDQKTYVNVTECGTVMCFAGTALHLSGYRPIVTARVNYGYGFNYMLDSEGHKVDVPLLAEKLLGITPFEANMLFASKNTLEDLERIVSNLIFSEVGLESVDVG